MLREFNITHVKITDVNGKKIMQFLDEASPESLMMKLDSYMPSIQHYGRVNMIAANDSMKSQNWKDCYQWPVSTNFSHITNANQQPIQQQKSFIPTGYISQNEATLQAELLALKMQMQLNDKIAELEKKYATKPESETQQIERMVDKYGPMAMALMGFQFTPENMATMSQMYQMQGMMNGTYKPQPQTGINGTQTTAAPEQKQQVQMTKEEQDKAVLIVQELDKLSTSIGDDNILQMVKFMNDNPDKQAFVLQFINSQKQQ